MKRLMLLLVIGILFSCETTQQKTTPEKDPEEVAAEERNNNGFTLIGEQYGISIELKFNELQLIGDGIFQIPAKISNKSKKTIFLQMNDYFTLKIGDFSFTNTYGVNPGPMADTYNGQEEYNLEPGETVDFYVHTIRFLDMDENRVFDEKETEIRNFLLNQKSEELKKNISSVYVIYGSSKNYFNHKEQYKIKLSIKKSK